MAKNLSISIPQPCHENWGDMTAAEQGRHCSSCNKVVVDFTTMTDAQMVEYFKASRQKTCGRFRTDQLDRKIKLKPVEKPMFPFKYVAASLMATAALAQTAGAKDLRDTAAYPVTQIEKCIDDTLEAKASIIDSCASVEAPIVIMTGDTVVNYQFPIEAETVLTINGGAMVTMGFCSMPETPELKQVDSPIFKYIPARVLYLGQTLKNRLNPASLKRADEIPKKRTFNFSFAAVAEELKLRRWTLKRGK